MPTDFFARLMFIRSAICIRQHRNRQPRPEAQRSDGTFATDKEKPGLCRAFRA